MATAHGKRQTRERTVNSNGNKPKITKKEFLEALKKVSRKVHTVKSK